MNRVWIVTVSLFHIYLLFCVIPFLPVNVAVSDLMITRSHLTLCWQNLFSTFVMVVLVGLIDLRNILSFPCWGEWQTKVVVPRMANLLAEVSLKCVMVSLSYLKLLLLLSGDIETNPGPGMC